MPYKDVLKTLGKMDAKLDQHALDIHDIKEKQEELRQEITRYKGFVGGVKYVMGGVVVVGGAIAKIMLGKV